jgi:hypothetical protein
MEENREAITTYNIPKNPGSKDHLTNLCRPCKKFVFNDLNSCRYGFNCMLCHCQDHVRPRNTRNRIFIIQRRQYIERKYSYPLWLTILVDTTYSIFPEINIIINKKLLLINHTNKEIKIQIMYQEINRIGKIDIIAKNKYSNNLKTQNSNFESNVLTIHELNSRFIWLKGICHFIILKLFKANINETIIEEHVNEIIEMIKKIPNII